MKMFITIIIFAFVILWTSVCLVNAALINVAGTDAIFLAGRTDVTIPSLGDSDTSFPLSRHSFVLPDFLQETFPESVSVNGGMLFSFDVSGYVHYYNGNATTADPGFGPDGGLPDGSSLSSLGGISGYEGPQGALVGIFLDDSVPSGWTGLPDTADFRTTGIGTSFTSLSPELGQVFFIGDGFTETGETQIFAAPDDATRLFLGIPDGFSFVGAPGAYEDNDGSFQAEIKAIPLPATIVLFASGLAGLAGLRRRFRK